MGRSECVYAKVSEEENQYLRRRKRERRARRAADREMAKLAQRDQALDSMTDAAPSAVSSSTSSRAASSGPQRRRASAPDRVRSSVRPRAKTMQVAQSASSTVSTTVLTMPNYPNKPSNSISQQFLAFLPNTTSSSSHVAPELLRATTLPFSNHNRLDASYDRACAAPVYPNIFAAAALASHGAPSVDLRGDAVLDLIDTSSLAWQLDYIPSQPVGSAQAMMLNDVPSSTSQTRASSSVSSFPDSFAAHFSSAEGHPRIGTEGSSNISAASDMHFEEDELPMSWTGSVLSLGANDNNAEQSGTDDSFFASLATDLPDLIPSSRSQGNQSFMFAKASSFDDGSHQRTADEQMIYSFWASRKTAGRQQDMQDFALMPELCRFLHTSNNPFASQPVMPLSMSVSTPHERLKSALVESP